LSGRIESTEGNAEELFDNWLSTLIGSLSSPLIDAGGRRAETERTQAVLRESIAAYRATVIQAINEVEQALNLEETQANYTAALEVRLNAAKQAYDESLQRYRNGAIDYTTVLFQLNTLQQIERLQISAQADQISYRINLLRSLGGNWVKQLEEPGESNEEN
jgi:outer membrane protein TolC